MLRFLAVRRHAVAANHLTIFAVIGVLVASGCTHHAKLVETKGVDTAEAQAANGRLAIDVYHRLADDKPDGNLFFSPYSLSTALNIAAAGADGQTALEMANVLSGTPDEAADGDNTDQTSKRLKYLRLQTAALNEQLKPSPDTVELQSANALWVDQRFPLGPKYLETVESHFGEAAFPVDFQHAADAARQRINSWAEKQTHDRIKDLIPAGELDANTLLIITNAVYFKGLWQKPFEDGSTRPSAFHLPGGKQRDVQTMHQYNGEGARYAAFHGDGSKFPTPQQIEISLSDEDPSLYPAADGLTMVDLPYRGEELSMTIIVPQSADGLAALENKLTNGMVRSWAAALQQRTVNLFVPKFKMQMEYDLSSTLQSLGMKRAFTEQAEFQGLSDGQKQALPPYIGLVKQKVFVEVSEKGTEAAAVTQVDGKTSAAPSKRELEPPKLRPFIPIFRADKPFLFLIRHNKTGTILFLGRVTNPEA